MRGTIPDGPACGRRKRAQFATLRRHQPDMGHRTHSHRILRARWCGAGLPAALACLLLLSTAPAAEQAVLGRITGRILTAPEGTNFSAIKVVLVQFRLDAKGVPQGSTLQTVMVDSDGGYAFNDVPIEPQTVYQIGARLNDTMLGSEAFTFPKGERKVMMNLRVPGMELVSVSIPEDANIIGRPLNEIELPPNSFITLMVKKGGATLPTGRSVVEPSDELVAVVPEGEEQILYDILTGV